MNPQQLTCKEVFEQLSEYIDGELDPELCRCLDEHIQDCEPCVAFIQTLRETVHICNDLPEETAPQISIEQKQQLRTIFLDWLEKDRKDERN